MKRVLLVLILSLAAFTFVWWTIRYLWYIIWEPNESWRLAISLDQLANTTFNGHEDDTISSRAGRHSKEDEHRECWAVWLCRILDKLDPNHCEKSIGV